MAKTTDQSAPAESLTPAPADALKAWMQAITPGAAHVADPALERDGVNPRAAKSWTDAFVTGRTNGKPTT